MAKKQPTILGRACLQCGAVWRPVTSADRCPSCGRFPREVIDEVKRYASDPHPTAPVKYIDRAD